MGHHHVIRPVERDCICPTRPPVAHTPQCEEAFRTKFFGAWNRERDRFYGPGEMRGAPPQPSRTAPRRRPPEFAATRAGDAPPAAGPRAGEPS